MIRKNQEREERVRQRRAILSQQRSCAGVAFGSTISGARTNNRQQRASSREFRDSRRLVYKVSLLKHVLNIFLL